MAIYGFNFQMDVLLLIMAAIFGLLGGLVSNYLWWIVHNKFNKKKVVIHALGILAITLFSLFFLFVYFNFLS
ncbi:MAG: hypothetical protein AABX51_00370 [Nanoarchaeota archaeon]|mgnify:CR=1 FL=1